MARLTPFMKDLSTPEERIAAADALMAHVYGYYDPAKASSWQPKPLEDVKSRYLWTDAFGVVNYISLACETGKMHYLDQADALIKAVHNTLGRQRGGHPHAPRLGDATEDHPTLGGLRIGKKDPEGETDGDGQYWHYLTKWAFALNRMSIARGDPRYNLWAEELIAAAYPRFVHRSAGSSGPPHMFWKMSIDFKRPAVPSEGNLDPFDGLVTVQLIKAGSLGSPEKSPLAAAEADFTEMVKAKYPRYSSTDPLDLGEALWLTHWSLNEPWALAVAEKSAASLEKLWKEGYFEEHPGYRLAFREFGTTLGVQVNEIAPKIWKDRVATLHAYWATRVLDRDSDISPVMMAASLLPGAWDKTFEEKLKNIKVET